MKPFHHTLLGIFVGIVLSAALYLITAPPRGAAVDLLPAPTPAPILVHIDGAVRSPGVYALEHGSRVQNAVDAAGGFVEQANSSAVNLAAGLKDGDKLHIPAAGTPMAPLILSAPSQGESAAEVSTGPVNLNTAGLEELGTLPGIGPTRAQQIMDYREQHGGFQTIEEILEVPGIGPASFERLKALITVDTAVP